MALCKDPTLTYLNQHGYNVVRAPRAGIQPLDVLGRDGGSLERLGSLGQIWASDAEPPPLMGPRSAAQLEGKRTAQLKLSIGLKLLSDVLGAMGAGVPEVDAAYSRARTIEFQFSGVQTLGVDPFSVGAWLASGDLAAGNPFVKRYFEDDEAEAYVITEVLTATAIRTAARDANGSEVAIDVPVIQGAVGGKVALKSEGETTLTYEGREPLVFGFKAYGIEYDRDWKVQGIEPSEAMAFDVPGAEPAAPLLAAGRVSLR